jgi:hypothetical protein
MRSPACCTDFRCEIRPVAVEFRTATTVVNPNVANQYIAWACQFTQPVEYSVYPGVNHQVIPFAAMNEYVGWVGARFAGKPAPSNCSSPSAGDDDVVAGFLPPSAYELAPGSSPVCR